MVCNFGTLIEMVSLQVSYMLTWESSIVCCQICHMTKLHDLMLRWHWVFWMQRVVVLRPVTMEMLRDLKTCLTQFHGDLEIIYVWPGLSSVM
jgi:hypothetical protein